MTAHCFACCCLTISALMFNHQQGKKCASRTTTRVPQVSDDSVYEVMTKKFQSTSSSSASSDKLHWIRLTFSSSWWGRHWLLCLLECLNFTDFNQCTFEPFDTTWNMFNIQESKISKKCWVYWTYYQIEIIYNVKYCLCPWCVFFVE